MTILALVMVMICLGSVSAVDDNNINATVEAVNDDVQLEEIAVEEINSYDGSNGDVDVVASERNLVGKSNDEELLGADSTLTLVSGSTTPNVGDTVYLKMSNEASQYLYDFGTTVYIRNDGSDYATTIYRTAISAEGAPVTFSEAGTYNIQFCVFTNNANYYTNTLTFEVGSGSSSGGTTPSYSEGSNATNLPEYYIRFYDPDEDTFINVQFLDDWTYLGSSPMLSKIFRADGGVDFSKVYPNYASDTTVKLNKDGADDSWSRCNLMKNGTTYSSTNGYQLSVSKSSTGILKAYSYYTYNEITYYSNPYYFYIGSAKTDYSTTLRLFDKNNRDNTTLTYNVGDYVSISNVLSNSQLGSNIKDYVFTRSVSGTEYNLENLDIYLNGELLYRSGSSSLYSKTGEGILINLDENAKNGFSYQFENPGWYNFTAKYSGNDLGLLASESQILSIYVKPEASEIIGTEIVIETNASSVSKDGKITVTPTVTADGNAVESGTVEFYDENNQLIGSINLEESESFEYTVTGEAGTHSIWAKYLENTELNYGESSSNKKDYKIKGILTITLARDGEGEVYSGDSVTFKITYSDSISNKIEIWINETKLYDEDASQSTSITFDESDLGINNVFIKFLGNDDFEACESNVVSVNVEKYVEPQIIFVRDANYPENTTIEIVAEGEYTAVIQYYVIRQDSASMEEINGYIDGTYTNGFYTDSLIDSSYTTLKEFTFNESGTYEIQLKYKYMYGFLQEAVKESNILTYKVTIVEKPHTDENITVEAKEVTYPDKINVTVKSTFDGDYTVKIGTHEYDLTVQNGIGSILVDALKAGEYTVDVVSKDNEIITNSTKLSIKQGNAGLTADSNATSSMKYGDLVKFTYTLDSKATGTVAVYEGNSQIANITVGEEFSNLALTAGLHFITLKYSGDENFTSATSDIITFTISAADNNMEIEVSNETAPNEVSIKVKADLDGKYTITIGDNTLDIDVVDNVYESTYKLGVGNYTAVLRYAGDNLNYNSQEVKTSFKVSPRKSGITATPSSENIVIGNSVEISTAVSETGAGGNVQFIFDDGTESVTKAIGETVEYTPKTAGKHTITVKYLSDGDFANETITLDINVDKKVNNIKIEVTPGKYPETTTVNVTADVDGDYVVDINETKLFVKVSQNKGSNTISLKPGNYVADITYGNDTYEANVEKASFTVKAGDVEITDDVLDVNTPSNGDNPTFSINLPEDADGNLTVTVNGKNYTKELVNGKATVEITDLSAGKYDATVSYSGGKNYGASEKNVTFEVARKEVKADTALNIDTPANSDSPTFSIDLPNATGNFTVTVDGKSYTKELVNGKASITLENLSEGSHNITVYYSGDANYSPITKNTTISIAKPKITENKDISVFYNSGAKYTVRIIGSDGVPVGRNQEVTFKLNGVVTKAKTNANGYASIVIKEKPANKAYTIEVSYNGVSVVNKVTVKHILTAKNLKVKKSARVLKIKVTLKKVNKKSVKGKKLTLKIKGKKYTAKTNKKGVATFKVKKNLLKKLKRGKTYTYKVTYLKDTISKKVTVKR